jgi:glycosyltransferase involved in cell wall biosynthesis
MIEGPLVSVILPTYKHANFINRALASLYDQQFTRWELIIINDGSPDETHHLLQPVLKDPRVRYYRHDRNYGLGATLNAGLAAAQTSLITYLPSDDVIYKDHLQKLFDTLTEADAVLAYSSVRHHYNRTASIVNNEWLQLVQVMHRKTNSRWTARSELESDDLNLLFWNKLKGKQVHTGTLTCEWVDHPHQRYKIMQEPVGGINTFRAYYHINTPLIYKSTKGNFIDEVSRYAPYRKKQHAPPADDHLKILLVGELAYNAERVLALEERGHQLYGLWMQQPYWYNYVGPLPFGNIKDIDISNWRSEVERIQPDLIYALLNWQAVPIACEVLRNNPGVPFVWHFKEGPFICLEKGTWNELMELYTKADGKIYTSAEMKDWFHEFLSIDGDGSTFVMDGDLPKKDWFQQSPSALLSEKDGEFHTVVPGRPIGLHPWQVQELAKQKIHLHFYGDFTQGQWREWIEKSMNIANGYLHIHPNVNQEHWVQEFSQYDAGWLHFFESENYGEIKRANWDDLNIPARLATLVLSGVPLLQRNNDGHIVATQSLAKALDIGLFFDSMQELGSLLNDRSLLKRLRENTWRCRHLFTFDHHTDDLIRFFRSIILKHKNQISSNGRPMATPGGKG